MQLYQLFLQDMENDRLDSETLDEELREIEPMTAVVESYFTKLNEEMFSKLLHTLDPQLD